MNLYNSDRFKRWRHFYWIYRQTYRSEEFEFPIVSEGSLRKGVSESGGGGGGVIERSHQKLTTGAR